MNRLPFSAGREWIRQGFDLFRRQPGTLATMFLAYLLFMMVAGLVPYVGTVLETLMLPVLSAAFMLACLKIERGERAPPSLIIDGLRPPYRKPLLLLGVVYLAVGLVAVGVTMLLDGGVFWEAARGQIDTRVQENQVKVMRSMMIAGAVSLPFTLALCFAVPLILWQRMAVGKAVFYSFFAVLRERAAFAGFVLRWILMLVAISVVVALLGVVVSRYAALLIMPVTVMLWIVLNCSFYAAYRQVFGSPAAPPVGDAGTNTPA